MGLAGALLLPECGSADCRGRDLFPEMKRSDPRAFADLEARAAALPFRYGRMFRVSKGESAPSFLFGTLHLADPRIATLSNPVHADLARASIVAVESTDVTAPVANPDAEARASQEAAILAPPERRADHLLDPEAFAALEVLALDRGLPKAALRRFKPTVLAVLLDQPPCAARAARRQSYLDAAITQAARAAGIAVLGLETLAEQFTALDGLAPEVERALLVSVLRQAGRGADVIETQILRYTEGDSGALLSWLASAHPLPGIVEAQTPPPFVERLVERRTRRMHDRILPLLARGNAFIAVGILHLPGPAGLAALLQESGFTVDRVE